MRKYYMIINTRNKIEALELLVKILIDNEINNDVTVECNEDVHNGIREDVNGAYKIILTCNNASTKKVIAKKYNLENVYRNRAFKTKGRLVPENISEYIDKLKYYIEKD